MSEGVGRKKLSWANLLHLGSDKKKRKMVKELKYGKKCHLGQVTYIPIYLALSAFYT